jgi:uncharacterized protein YndB with AHSA1/START domain
VADPRFSDFDERLDLVVARDVPVAPETAWAAWTRPEHLRHWYAPAPGGITDCEVDLRPGGTFRFVIGSPDGDEHEVRCCYLVVEPCRRLAWTDALAPGYRPARDGFFTAVMTLEPRGEVTVCRAVAMHGREHDRDLHDELGFHDGWGTVLDQLVAFAPTIG